jgi:uncharacterized membrane protein YgcG
MTFELDHDLTAWAEGTLSRQDLFTLQGQQARTVVALHERLLGAAEMAAPDPVAGWALLQASMDAKVVSIRTRPRPRLRRAVLGIAAAALIGGGAFAAIRGGAVEHPDVLAPSAGSDLPGDGADRTGREGGLGDVTGDRSSGPSPAGPTATDGSTQGPLWSDGTGSTSGSGSGATGGSGDSTDGSGSTSGGGGTQDPTGQHPGQGNGGEDNGNDGPHGHGAASAPARG